jgi:hypothetical protein
MIDTPQGKQDVLAIYRETGQWIWSTELENGAKFGAFLMDRWGCLVHRCSIAINSVLRPRSRWCQ